MFAYFFLFSANLYSQNCKALESKPFFKSIKLGGQIPLELVEYLKPLKLENPYYNDYHLSYDSLNEFCKKKYADIFKFQSIQFSNSLVSTNKKGQIIHIEQYYFFEQSSRDNPVKEPANFTKLLKDLKSQYGEPTKVEETKNKESFQDDRLGHSKIIIWECNKVTLQLRVNYGSDIKGLNVLDIQIRNELIEEIEFLQ